MTKTRAAPAAIASLALRRSAAYELLARAFSYPAEEDVAGLRACAEEVSEALTGTAVAALGALAGTAAPDALLPGYQRLFSLSSSPDCPLFESAFVCEQAAQQTSVMADVAGFYRAFGVETPGGGLRPDDIRAELDFMAYLCRKEAYALLHRGAARTAQTQRAERMFLEEHLGAWGPGLGSRILASGQGDAFYAALGTALRVWVEDEMSRLGAQPVSVQAAPRMDLSRPAPEPEDYADDEGAVSPTISLDSIPVL